MRMYHMNGCGNRFAIFEAILRPPFRPTDEKVRRIAHEGGAQIFDQIIGMEQSVRADVFMRIWNADGSSVKACGNATRCVASIMFERSEASEVTIETDAGLLKARREKSGDITVDMGSPLLTWEHVPLSEKMDTRGVDLKIGPIDAPILSTPACVSMGNPHAVFFVKNVDDYDIPAIGPLVEWHPLFPEGVNVGFAQIIDKSTIRLRVWERGAGLTRACGTGACAALVCAVRLKKTKRKAKVLLDGGQLLIEWRERDDHVLMTGPVVMEGVFEV